MQFEDVLASVRQNMATIKTVRVTWQRRHEYTPSFREYHREMAKVLTREIQGGRLSKEEKAQLTLRFEQSKKMATYDPILWLDQDYWTDGENFQIRFMSEPGSPGRITRTGAVFKPLVFPNDESRPDNLRTIFNEVQIYGQGTATGNQTRRWQGDRAGGAVVNSDSRQRGSEGRLVNAMSFGADPMEQFGAPPLMSVRPEWDAMEHSLTHVFNDVPGEAHIWGEAELDGHSTLLLGRTWKRPGGGGCLRAFVRPDLGYLPVRVEFALGMKDESLRALRPLSGEESYATQIVRCTRAEEVHPGFFYPMEGVIEKFGPSAETVRRPEVIPPFYALHQITTWQVTKIEVNRPMDAEMFALRFPEGANYYDGATGLQAVDGSAEEFARKAMPQARSRSSRWLTYALALATSVAAFFFGRRFWIKRAS